MNQISGPVEQFARRRRRTVAQLRTVSDALDRWEEWESCEAMPEDFRPVATKPRGDRAALKGRRALLLGVLGEIEEMWERRN